MTTKRIIALLMCLCMMVSLLPFSFAAKDQDSEAAAGEEVAAVQETTGEETPAAEQEVAAPEDADQADELEAFRDEDSDETWTADQEVVRDGGGSASRDEDTAPAVAPEQPAEQPPAAEAGYVGEISDPAENVTLSGALPAEAAVEFQDVQDALLAAVADPAPSPLKAPMLRGAAPAADAEESPLISEDNVLAAFDLKLTDTTDDSTVQPDGTVTVTMDVSDMYLPENVVILHFLDSVEAIAAALEAQEADPENANKVEFVTDASVVENELLQDAVAAAMDYNNGGERGVYVETITPVIDRGIMSFETGSFSVYAVVPSVTPRLTVKFMNGTTELATMYVKAADTPDEVATIIYDPSSAITLTDNQVFKGWTTADPDTYNLSSEILTIAQVRENAMTQVRADGFTDNTVTYYAALFNHYSVTYRDPTGLITIDTDVVEIPIREDQVSYTVNQSYSTDSEHNFEGWIPKEGSTKIVGYPGNAHQETLNGTPVYYYKNDETITIRGDVTFSVDAPEGHWLVFDENGKGATYNAPQFVKSGEVTQQPSLTMQRYGYDFIGWFEGPVVDGVPTGDEFSFGDEIADTTTIYAKWEAHTQARYSVIIWLENLSCTGYDFAASVNLTGNINDPASNAVVIGGGAEGTGASYVTVNDVTYNGANDDRFKGFHYARREATNNDKIVPEGTTVVNVYYDRTEYTLKFYYARSQTTGGTPVYGRINRGNANNGTISGFTGTQGNYYYTSENENTRVYWRNGYFREDNRPNATRYTGPVWERVQTGTTGGTETFQVSSNHDATAAHPNTGGRWGGSGTTKPGGSFGTEGSETRGNYTYYYKTLTAKYGTFIGDKWPTYDGEDFAVWNGYRLGSWAIMHTSQAYIRDQQGTVKGKITIMDEEILGDLTSENGNYVYANYDTASSQYEWTYHIYFQNESGEGYTFYEDITALSHDPGGNWATQQHPPAYEGMTEIESMRQHPSTLEVNYYYTRDLMQLTYMDGVYVTGNGNAVEGKAPVGELDKIEGIAYGADIGKYGKGGTAYFEPSKENVTNEAFDPDGFVFAGWYSDKECTHEYEFVDDQGRSKTMPEGGITVYAKWIQIQYRVFLHPNAGKDNTLNWGSDGQAMNFRVDFGEKISKPDATRAEFELLGWYTDESFSKAFSEEMVLNDNTVTTEYDKTKHMTDVMDKFGDVSGDNEHDGPWNADLIGYNGGDRFWITREFNLYARWSAKLIGAKGIGVIYDANGGTSAPSDTDLYADNSDVRAGKAATPPANKVFDHWELQTWNGNAFVTKEDAAPIYPGGTFIALKSDARITDKVTGQVVSSADLDSNGQYNYTIQLKAIYKDGEQETPAHIKWFRNDGSSGSDQPFHVDEQVGEGEDARLLRINEPVDIQGPLQRDGYTFVGWARVPENSDFSQEITGSTPFLYYNKADGKFYTEDSFTTEVSQVAADKKDPTHAIIAVWAPKTYTVKIKKMVAEGDTSEVFSFDAPSFSPAVSGDGYTDGFTLSDGGTKVYEKVPYGTTFTVSETTEGINYDASLSYTVTDADDASKNVSDKSADNGDRFTVDGNITVTVTNTLSVTSLTITKRGTMENHESAVFTVKGVGNDVDLTVAIPIQKGSVTIKGLPVGEYTVTEKNGWSWRYEPKTYTFNDGTETAWSDSVSLTLSGDSNTLVVENEKDNTQWLSGMSWAVNNWASQDCVQLPAPKSVQN